MGVAEGGGFNTAVRGTMFVRNGAVTPGPSRERDISFSVESYTNKVDDLPPKWWL